MLNTHTSYPRPLHTLNNQSKFNIGDVVEHKEKIFRGIIYDIDFQPSTSSQSSTAETIIKNNGPFYHIIAETEDLFYIAYASEKNLMPNTNPEPLKNPNIKKVFHTEDALDKASYLETIQKLH